MAKAKEEKKPNLWRYEVQCKGVGRWHIDLPENNQSDDAQEAYLKNFGIVATDHAIQVSEPYSVTAEGYPVSAKKGEAGDAAKEGGGPATGKPATEKSATETGQSAKQGTETT